MTQAEPLINNVKIFSNLHALPHKRVPALSLKMMMTEALCRFRHCLFLFYLLVTLSSFMGLTHAIFMPLTPNLIMRRHSMHPRPLMACIPASVPFAVVPPLAYDFPLRLSTTPSAREDHLKSNGTPPLLTQKTHTLYNTISRLNGSLRQRSWRVPTRTDSRTMHGTAPIKYARSRSPGSPVDIPDIWMFN
jgi:hypothetical protein